MYKNIIKRFLDIIFSLLLIPFLLPFILVFGILIKLEDNGPIFYVSNRLGENKRIFKILKFRSMKVNSPDLKNKDGSTYNSSSDPRVTRVGKLIRKTSIDELPQLFNVLIGDMSFIGPRPDLPEALKYYTPSDIRKLDVKPGISGYSQAYYRNSISQSEKFKNDIYYVNNMSLFLDLKIIIVTIKNVFISKNINVSNNGN